MKFRKRAVLIFVLSSVLAAGLLIAALRYYSWSPAVEMISRKTLLLRGVLNPDLLSMYKSITARMPELETIRIQDSPGGNEFVANFLRGEIKRRQLKVEVSGGCVSACANLYLSSPEHHMLASASIRPTYLHFHGTYSISKGNLLHEVPTSEIDEAQENTSHKMPRELYTKARNTPHQNGGLLVFREPVDVNGKSFTSFFCSGEERHRPIDCATLNYSAQELGL